LGEKTQIVNSSVLNVYNNFSNGFDIDGNNVVISNAITDNTYIGFDIDGNNVTISNSHALNNRNMGFNVNSRSIGIVVSPSNDGGEEFCWETPCKIAELKDINMMAVGTDANYTLLTIDTNHKVILTEVQVRNRSTTGYSSAPVWNIGSNASSYNNFIGSATLAATSTGTYEKRHTTNTSIPVYNSTSIIFSVKTAAVATSMQADVMLIGYYTNI
jgi:hypothetical protein